MVHVFSPLSPFTHMHFPPHARVVFTCTLLMQGCEMVWALLQLSLVSSGDASPMEGGFHSALQQMAPLALWEDPQDTQGQSTLVPKTWNDRAMQTHLNAL